MKSSFEEKFENLKKHSSGEQAVLLEAQKVLFNYPNSTELVELPSKGRFYPVGHPLHNRDTIEIKEMTAKEEDILSNKSFIRKGILVDKLLESIIVDKTIPVESIVVGDKNAIIVAARKNAYGPTYDLNVNCLNCMSRNSVSVDLNEVTFNNNFHNFPSEDGSGPKLLDNGNVQITLPRTKWILECKIMSSPEEQKIIKILEDRRKNKEIPELSMLDQLSLIVVSINYTDDKDLITAAIEALPASDAKVLREQYYSIVPNIKIQKKYNCSSCTLEQELEVPFTEEFFWPE